MQDGERSPDTSVAGGEFRGSQRKQNNENPDSTAVARIAAGGVGHPDNARGALRRLAEGMVVDFFLQPERTLFAQAAMESYMKADNRIGDIIQKHPEKEAQLRGILEKMKGVVDQVRGKEEELFGRIDKLKRSEDPLERALGYDLEIHMFEYQLGRIEEELAEIQKELADPKISRKKKEELGARQNGLNERKKVIEEGFQEEDNDEKKQRTPSLQELKNKRGELKDNQGRKIPDRVIEVVEGIVGRELSEEEQKNPLKAAKAVFVEATEDEGKRTELINRLKENSVLTEEQAKKVEDFLTGNQEELQELTEALEEIQEELETEEGKIKKEEIKGKAITVFGIAGVLLILMIIMSSKQPGGQ